MTISITSEIRKFWNKGMLILVSIANKILYALNKKKYGFTH